MTFSDGKKKRILFQYVWLLAAAALILLLVWLLQVRQITARHEWVLDAGAERMFTAEDTVIQAVGFSYDDVDKQVYGQYEPVTFTGTIRVLEEDARSADHKVALEQKVRDRPVNTLSLSPAEGLLEHPVSIERGQLYRVELVDASGRDVPGITIAFYGSDRSFAGLYWFISIGILVVLSVLYFFYERMIKFPFALAWIAGIVAVCAVESAAMTPLCVPDGELHFYSAYAMSSQMMQKIPALRGLSRMVPQGILRMQSFGKSQYVFHFWSDWQSGNQLVPRADNFFLVGNYPHYIYVIPAIGLTIARILRAPWQMYLLLGQMMNVLLYAVATYLAVRLMPEWKRAIAAITFLPSTLWMINSFSYDVWNLAFLILAVAWCGWMGKKEQVTVPELLAGVILMLAFIPIKFIYFNVALFLLLVSPRQWKVRNRKVFLAVIVGVIACGIIAVFAARGQEIITFLGAGGFDQRSANDQYSTYTLTWAVHHPAQMVLLYLKSIYDFGVELFLDTFLGDNFQMDIPGVLAAGILVLFGIVMSGSAAAVRKKRTVVLSRVVLITGILIVMTSFVFVYSQRPESGIGSITGMQGRYFLPYLICLPMCVKGVPFTRRHARGAWYLLAAVTMISMMTRFLGILRG